MKFKDIKKKGLWKLIVGVLFGVSGAVSLANGAKGSFASFLICFIFVFWWSYPYSKKSAKSNHNNSSDYAERVKERFLTIEEVVEISNREHEEALSTPELAPETLNGLKRSYYYRDYDPMVFWQYGGRYGKSCKSIGMKYGDPVELRPEPYKGELDDNIDYDNVSLYWKGINFGLMRKNRLRGMVKDWIDAGKPIYCAVNTVGGEQHHAYLEIAFYGYVRKKAD